MQSYPLEPARARDGHRRRSGRDENFRDLDSASSDISMRSDSRRTSSDANYIPTRTRPAYSSVGRDDDQSGRPMVSLPHGAPTPARYSVPGNYSRPAVRDRDSDPYFQRQSPSTSGPQRPQAQNRETARTQLTSDASGNRRTIGQDLEKPSYVTNPRTPYPDGSHQRLSAEIETKTYTSAAPVTSRIPIQSGSHNSQISSTYSQTTREQNPPGSRVESRSVAREVQDFIDEVPLHNFRACSEFINAHPAILRDPGIRNALVSKAEQNLKNGDRTLVESCVEKALIVQTCRNLSEDKIADYFHELSMKNPQAIRQFYKGFDTLLAETRQRIDKLPADLASEQDTSRYQGMNQQRGEKRYHTQGTLEQPTYSRIQSTTQDRQEQYTTRARENPQHMPQQPTSRARENTQAPLAQSPKIHQSYVQDFERLAISRDDGAPDWRSGETQRGQAIQQTISSTEGSEINKKRRAQDTVITSTNSAANQTTSLDPSWQVRHSSFFKPGRVFAVLWHESVPNARSPTPSSYSEPTTVVGRYGQQIYTSVRRFVVVKMLHGSSWVIPITTYGGRGLSKAGLSREDREAHTIIYEAGTLPFVPPGPRLPKNPISMRARPGTGLPPPSLINFARIYTVEHNVKVKDIGFITDDSMMYLLEYWKRQVNE